MFLATFFNSVDLIHLVNPVCYSWEWQPCQNSLIHWFVSSRIYAWHQHTNNGHRIVLKQKPKKEGRANCWISYLYTHLVCHLWRPSQPGCINGSTFEASIQGKGAAPTNTIYRMSAFVDCNYWCCDHLLIIGIIISPRQGPGMMMSSFPPFDLSVDLFVYFKQAQGILLMCLITSSNCQLFLSSKNCTFKRGASIFIFYWNTITEIDFAIQLKITPRVWILCVSFHDIGAETGRHHTLHLLVKRRLSFGQ